MINEIYKNLSLENTDGEIWKDIPNYIGLYQVSNLGRVKRLFKIIEADTMGRKYELPEIIMSQYKDKFNRLNLNLIFNNKPKHWFVHRLVGITFIPNLNNLPCIHHKNHNPSFNNVQNLMWVTKKQNAEFAKEAGRLKQNYRNKIKQKHKNSFVKDIIPKFYSNQNFKPDDEIWLDINNYDGDYKISNYGRVLSFKKRNPEGKLIKPTFTGNKNPNGRPISIGFSKNGIRKTFLVSRLVAFYFIPNPLNLPEVNHINGRNKTNNHTNNLEWSTHLDNCLHALRTGLRKDFGEGNIHAKLNEKDIIEIRKCHNNGDSYCSLAEKYNVSIRTIMDLVKRKSWKHIL